MEDVFSFLKLVEEKKDSLTRFAGAPLFFEFLEKIKFPQHIAKYFPPSSQGYPPAHLLLSLITLQVLGGNSISDIQSLESDAGLKRFWNKLEKKNWAFLQPNLRKKRTRTFASPTTFFDFLKQFQAKTEDKDSSSLDPRLCPSFLQLEKINEDLCRMQQKASKQSRVTLDMDNNLISSQKRCAQYSYKKEKSFAPFNVYHKESGLMLHSRFLDGNEKPGAGQQALLEKSLQSLSSGIKEVFVRSDSAGYQNDFLRAMDCGIGRFKKIHFSVSCKVYPSFRKSVQALDESCWIPLKKRDQQGYEFDTGKEIALVDYCPEWSNPKKSDPSFRYIAIREAVDTQTQFNDNGELEFDCSEYVEKRLHLESMQNHSYKVFGIVSNDESRSIEEIVLHHWGRCGDSEKVHSRLCSDFAGGRFPCDSFAANAAWWQISILALNVTSLFQRYLMKGSQRTCHMKRLRFELFHVAARMVKKSTNLLLKLKYNFECLEEIRSKIKHLSLCLC
jgi:hypothetical protein